MASVTHRLLHSGIITPPPWLASNLHLEVIMGSRAYGCHSEDSSDFDLRGVFTGPKAQYFPATQGLVHGFDSIPTCEHWCESHVKDPDGKREWDFDIHCIAKFLRLASENNPNQMDLLFVRESNITQISAIGRMLLDAKFLFPSKLAWTRYRGYASAQFHKLKRETLPTGKRRELVEKWGYDIKFGYHILRLLNQARQLLVKGDQDLMEGREEYKAIRAGEWTFERLEKEYEARKIQVEQAFSVSNLQERPDMDKVRRLLLNCLEHQYGSLSKVVARDDEHTQALRDIDAILVKHRGTL